MAFVVSVLVPIPIPMPRFTNGLKIYVFINSEAVREHFTLSG